MLTAAQIEFYREQGYLVVERLIPEDLLSELRVQVDQKVADAAKVTENDAVYDLEDSHAPGSPRVRRLKTPHDYLPAAAALARQSSVLEVLHALLGNAVRLQTSKLNMKAQGFGAPVEWHQDWAFYPHTNDDLLAAGVLMDDCTLENGPLMVIPGSHKGPIYDHHSNGYFCGAINPKRCDLDFRNAVPLTGPAGTVSFHHVRMVHGSAMNRSNRPRRLLLFQYTAADAWPLVEPVDDIKAYDDNLLSGTPTIEPRVEAVPIRLPLPPAPHAGSIYENQRGLENRFFEHHDNRGR